MLVFFSFYIGIGVNKYFSRSCGPDRGSDGRMASSQYLSAVIALTRSYLRTTIGSTRMFLKLCAVVVKDQVGCSRIAGAGCV